MVARASGSYGESTASRSSTWQASGAPDDARHDGKQSVRRYWFLQERGYLRPDPVAHIAVESEGRDQHDGWRIVQCVDDRDPVSARHPQVEQHHPDIKAVKEIEGNIAVLGDLDRETRSPEDLCDRSANGVIVVHDEDVHHSCGWFFAHLSYTTRLSCWHP